MKLSKPKITEGLTKEQAILYYLFVDDQLLCAWWDYLDVWDLVKNTESEQSKEFRDRIIQTMSAVDYWEDILFQLKKIITYDDIEEYIKQNPQITKSYLFSR